MGGGAGRFEWGDAAEGYGGVSGEGFGGSWLAAEDAGAPHPTLRHQMGALTRSDAARAQKDAIVMPRPSSPDGTLRVCPTADMVKAAYAQLEAALGDGPRKPPEDPMAGLTKPGTSASAKVRGLRKAARKSVQ